MSQPTADTSVDSTASSFLLSANSSSFATSSLDVDYDDIIDDATLRRPFTCATGNALRLSAVSGRLLRLAIEDDNSGRQATVDVDRLLRRVLPEPETESIFDLFDDVIAECGLDVAVEILLTALTRTRHSFTGSHLGHVIELLRAVQLLTSLDLKVGSCACTCDVSDVMITHDMSELDVQLTSLPDCITDDATLSRHLRHHSSGRSTDSRLWSRHVVYDDDGGSDPRLPALSVRLSGWCLCDEQRTAPLAQLLTDTRSVCELALVKINLDKCLPSWLSDALCSNTSLVRLDLRLSSLGHPDAAAALGKGLSRHRRMRTLNLAGTGLTDAGLRRLLVALSSNRKLVELDVGFNDLATGSGCVVLGNVLCTRRPPLRRLRMCEDGITWSTLTVAPFFRSVARSPRLRCLDVSGNALGDDGIIQLSEALLVNRSLHELHIEYCHFGPAGCRAMARALRSNDALRSLQMSRNDVGDNGFSQIADALRYNRAVTSLAANQCHVGNVGLSHLLETLRHNVTVTLVKLCYNDIGRHADHHESADRRQQRRGWVKSCTSLHVVKYDDLRSHRDNVDVKSSADVSLPTLFTTTQHISFTTKLTTMRYVRSFSDVTSGPFDDVIPPLYARLREVLHDNARLKILLWGNKIDSWIFEPRSKT